MKLPLLTLLLIMEMLGSGICHPQGQSFGTLSTCLTASQPNDSLEILDQDKASANRQAKASAVFLGIISIGGFVYLLVVAACVWRTAKSRRRP